jgi:hypothetical protein
MNSGRLNGSTIVGNVIIGSANHVFQPLQLKIRDLAPTGGLDYRFRPNERHQAEALSVRLDQ